MRLLTPLRLFSLVAALTLALPSVTQARDGGRGGHGGGGDRGHGGWHGGGDWHGGHGWHGGGWRGRGYWGGGWGIGYYPYWGWDYPYYGYPYDGAYYGRPAYYGGAADDLAVDVQRALKRRGYYGGSVDGQIGSGTRGALRNFQAEHRLAVTGRIDNSTLRALGL